MPSPVLHAPSLAQHRFVALMAVWFLGSLVFRVHLSSLAWFWMAPLQFFTGWSLMFLPGAVASHELTPQEGRGALSKQLIVWGGPPIVGLVALFLYLRVLGR